jgi:hypothetical protein
MTSSRKKNGTFYDSIEGELLIMAVDGITRR